MAAIDQYLQSNAERFEEELCELLRIPSVSADPACRGDMARAAEWVADQFRRLEFATELISTDGHPLVYAETPPVADAPTVLVYGHYDVQPPDPLELWTTAPFEPTRRDGKLFARGASDDKGQMLTHVKSAEAWMRAGGGLPLNLKFLVEGEEEVGSHALEKFIAANTERLACDCVVVSDGCQFGPERPAITFGLRGIACFELKLIGPKRDLHSGSFGGAVTNPANALAKLVGALVDDKGRIQLPGFYDVVRPLSDRERKELASLAFDEGQFFNQLAVDGAVGEEGYTALERRWARPTCDVNGLTSGYQGTGAKTVIPSVASAKLSFRLVPDQHPKQVAAALKQWLGEHCPPGIRWELADLHGSPGVLVSLESPFVEAAARAIERGFGRRPVFTREGGSIPIVCTFSEALKVDTLLLGWGLDDDNAHSPNEKFLLADFHRGIRASAALWEELGKLKK